jgi:hypothetical protein
MQIFWWKYSFPLIFTYRLKILQFSSQFVFRVNNDFYAVAHVAINFLVVNKRAYVYSFSTYDNQVLIVGNIGKYKQKININRPKQTLLKS